MIQWLSYIGLSPYQEVWSRREKNFFSNHQYIPNHQYTVCSEAGLANLVKPVFPHSYHVDRPSCIKCLISAFAVYLAFPSSSLEHQPRHDNSILHDKLQYNKWWARLIEEIHVVLLSSCFYVLFQSFSGRLFLLSYSLRFYQFIVLWKVNQNVVIFQRIYK